jgi:hypothetical protein
MCAKSISSAKLRKAVSNIGRELPAESFHLSHHPSSGRVYHLPLIDGQQLIGRSEGQHGERS